MKQTADTGDEFRATILLALGTNSTHPHHPSYVETYFVDNSTISEHTFTDLPPAATPSLVDLSQEVAFWLHRVFVPAVAFFGIAGNCATIRLMTRNRRMVEGPTRLYLTALATADLLYLSFSSTLSLFHLPYVKSPKFFYYWKYRPYGLWLTDSSSEFDNFDTFIIFYSFNSITIKKQKCITVEIWLHL